MDIINLSACELIQLINERKISPIEIAKGFVNQIKSLEPKINAWEYFDAEQALLSTHNHFLCGNKSKRPISLEGLPVGVKDVFNTKNFPTAMGSTIWKGFTPGNDARVIHNIVEHDGVVFGKTVTAEFAVHYLSSNKTKNPHNHNHTPGTSSSGSAAAVATKMVPLSIGTQTAGSIIRPASFCGVYGFKPSFGTIPRTGILKTTDSLDSVGCFANTIDDVELLFSIMHVKGKDYPFIDNKLKKPKKPNRIKVAILNSQLDVFNNYHPYATNAFTTLVHKLSSNSYFDVENFTPFKEMNDIHRHHSNIYDKTLSYYFSNEFQEQTQKLSPVIINAIQNGKKISKDQYLASLQKQGCLIDNFDSYMLDYDIILTLSTAGEAPLLSEKEIDDTCLIWTFLGLPALTIPVFKGPKNLPFGLQIVGKKYDDYKLLEMARQIEAALI